jgi:molybdopterin-binding protein
MKLSARNQFKGKVVEIKEGAVNGTVKIDIGGGNVISSVITMTSIKELGLAVGKEAYAVIKASSVMIGVD